MNELSSAPTSLQELKELLRRSGLRSTGPRLAVLQFLQRASGPLSHADIAEGLAVQGLDRTTVYRNLIALAEVSLVSRTDLGDHVWRFELQRTHASHVADHPHFVCNQCGDVQCLHDTQVLVTPLPNSPPSELPEIKEILLKGTCHRCKA